jgi:hypothetical protein
MSFQGYPKALSYAFSRMEGFSKITQRVHPLRTDEVKPGSTIKVAIEPNTLWDTRSFCMYYEFTTSAVGETAASGGTFVSRLAPRLSSSIVDTVSVFMNNYQVDTCMDYNLLYNTLYDMNASSVQTNKRFLENTNPAVKEVETYGAAGSTLTVKDPTTTDASDLSDIARPFVINNWVNMLGNTSVEYLDTSDCGLTEIAVRLAPSTICWNSTGTATTRLNVSDYTLNNIYFTYSKVIFKDTLYEQIKHDNLMSEAGLSVKFTSYETHIGPLQSRKINYQFMTNASSLDDVICTTRIEDYSTEGLLVDKADFCQSKYFQRDLSGCKSSQLFINGTAMSQQALSPPEIYNETLIALNDHNDMSNSSHAGLKSIGRFFKYYFAHILSLQYNKETSSPLISGLNGGGSSFTILWKTECDSAVTAKVYPVVYTASSRVLRIHGGKQINVEI